MNDEQLLGQTPSPSEDSLSEIQFQPQVFTATAH